MHKVPITCYYRRDVSRFQITNFNSVISIATYLTARVTFCITPTYYIYIVSHQIKLITASSHETGKPLLISTKVIKTLHRESPNQRQDMPVRRVAKFFETRGEDPEGYFRSYLSVSTSLYRASLITCTNELISWGQSCEGKGEGERERQILALRYISFAALSRVSHRAD